MINKTITDLPKSQSEVVITAGWSDVEPIWNETLTKLIEETEIPGFRKGYVPANIIESQQSQKLQDEFIKNTMPRLLVKVLQEAQIVPIDYPKYELISFVKGGDFSYKALVTKRPEVTIGNYKTMLIKKPSVKFITDADVDKTISDLFERWSKAQKRTTLTTQSQTSVPNNSSGSISFSNPASDQTVVDAASVITQPDESFAKAVGATSFADLRNKIKADLEADSKYSYEIEFEESILQEVQKITKVDLPEVLIEDELNRMLVSLQRKVADMGLLLDDYLKSQNKTIEGLKTEWRVRAEKNVRIELGLAEIAKQENITISDVEVQAEIDKVTDPKLKSQFEAEEPKLHLKHSLRQVKTLNYLKSQVK